MPSFVLRRETVAFARAAPRAIEPAAENPSTPRTAASPSTTAIRGIARRITRTSRRLLRCDNSFISAPPYFSAPPACLFYAASEGMDWLGYLSLRFGERAQQALQTA